MQTRSFAATGLTLAALFATSLPALAAPADNELQQLKDQITELRQSYEARLQALEARLREMQQSSSAAAAAAAAPPAAPTPSAASTSPAPMSAATASASAFNPSIALILNGTYANLSRDPAEFKLQVDTDLRRRQARAVGRVHRVEHVGHQRVQLGDVEGLHRLRDAQQARVAHLENLTHAHRAAPLLK